VDYPFDVSTKTANLTTATLLFNSVLSTPDAKFLTINLKDFYLGIPMSRYEYMCIPNWTMRPDDIIAQYNLKPLFHNSFVMSRFAAEYMASHKWAALPMLTNSLRSLLCMAPLSKNEETAASCSNAPCPCHRSWTQRHHQLMVSVALSHLL
jgi:hypothetical protein